MIHSRTRHGFTLIEVLLALSLASLVIVPLLMVQGSNTGYVGLFAQRLARVWRLERFFYIKQFDDGDEAKPEEVIREEIDDPGMSLLFERKSIPEESSLSGVTGLYLEQILARWDGVAGSEQEILVRVVFIQQKGEQ